MLYYLFYVFRTNVIEMVNEYASLVRNKLTFSKCNIIL